MPVYEYLSEGPDDPDRSCIRCARGFELRRPVDRDPLEVCPLCKNPLKKIVSNVFTPRVAKPFSAKEAKRAGFTVLEKRDEGVFEKL
jgi:hypothetical protein